MKKQGMRVLGNNDEPFSALTNKVIHLFGRL